MRLLAVTLRKVRDFIPEATQERLETLVAAHEDKRQLIPQETSCLYFGLNKKHGETTMNYVVSVAATEPSGQDDGDDLAHRRRLRGVV